MDLQRFQILENLIKENKCETIAEIGVARGDTANYILEKCKLKKYYLVDPDTQQVLIYDTAIRNYNHALFLRLYSNQAVKCIKDGELDLVFIDANHNNEAVEEDIILWSPKVKEGGIVCGHDYNKTESRGVHIAVDKFYPGANLEPDALDPQNLFVWWMKK